MTTLMIASASIVADWITKWLVWQYWPDRFVSNAGLPFGIPASLVFVLIFSTAILAVLFWYYLRLQKNDRLGNRDRIAFGFILGGALGNLSERILFGQVTDFIIVGVGIFNLADIFIFFGLLILVISVFNSQPLTLK